MSFFDTGYLIFSVQIICAAMLVKYVEVFVWCFRALFNILCLCIRIYIYIVNICIYIYIYVYIHMLIEFCITFGTLFVHFCTGWLRPSCATARAIYMKTLHCSSSAGPCSFSGCHLMGPLAIHPKKGHHSGIGRAIYLPYRALCNTFLLIVILF